MARVLADSSSAGAVYVDVRLPGRPAAGGLERLAGPEGRGGEGSTVAALAESLTGGKKEAAKIGAATGEAGGETTAEGSRESSHEGTTEGGPEASTEAGREGAAEGGGAEPSEGSEATTEPSG
jgi:hypothetical protein